MNAEAAHHLTTYIVGERRYMGGRIGGKLGGWLSWLIVLEKVPRARGTCLRAIWGRCFHQLTAPQNGLKVTGGPLNTAGCRADNAVRVPGISALSKADGELPWWMDFSLSEAYGTEFCAEDHGRQHNTTFSVLFRTAPSQSTIN